MTTYTSQPDETAGIDTRIVDTDANGNYGTADKVVIGKYSTTSTSRALIKFDLSSIPSSATIISATLSFYVKADNATASDTISVYRTKRNWVETQATWNIYSTGNNWGTAGGLGADDYDSTVWGTVAVSASESVDAEKAISLSISEFTKSINGTYSNYGWIVKTAEGGNSQYDYHSSSGLTAGTRPKLVVEYTVGTYSFIWISE